MYKDLDYITKWKAKEHKSFSMVCIPLMCDFLSAKEVRMLNYFRRVVYFLSNSNLSSSDLKVMRAQIKR